MSTPYGFGGGFLEGLAGSYANAQRLNLEQSMAERKNVWDTLSAALPNARPEAQVQIFQKLAGLASTPLHKKLDKSVTDFSDIIKAPPGYGASASQPSSGITPGNLESAVGQAPEASAYSPVPIHGGGMPAVPGIGPAGPPAPATGAARVPTDIQPPPVLSSVGQGPGVGMDQQLPGAQAPAYSPWYSPEEQSHIVAQRQAEGASMAVQQEIQARRQQAEELVAKGQLKPEDVARYSLGQAPYIVRFQQKLIQDPDDPTGQRNIMADYDSISGLTYKPGTTEVIQSPRQPGESKLGDVVPDKDSQTGWSRKIYARDGSVARLEKGAAPPAGYAPTESVSSGQNITVDPATGRQIVTPYTRSTATQRVVPGQTPTLTPPPSGAGAPQAGAIVRTPPEIVKAGDNVTQSQQRLDTMEKSLPAALAGDQQAMVNLLGAHIGMTVQGNSIRGTQSVWNEAADSAPWLQKALARWTNIDPATGDVVITLDPKMGVFLPKEMMQSMVSLGKQRVESAQKAFDSTKKQAGTGYGYGPGSGGPKKSATKAQVQAYANKFHLTYKQSEDEFAKEGITVEGR